MQIPQTWCPITSLTPEVKWREHGKYVSAVLSSDSQRCPVSASLVRRITALFESGGPRGTAYTANHIKAIEAVRNRSLIEAFEAAIDTTEQRIADYPKVFAKPFFDDGVKPMLHTRLRKHWLPATGLKHARLMLAWHGCSSAAMQGILTHGTADLRSTDGGFFGSGIYVTPHAGLCACSPNPFFYHEVAST